MQGEGLGVNRLLSALFREALYTAQCRLGSQVASSIVRTGMYVYTQWMTVGFSGFRAHT